MSKLYIVGLGPGDAANMTSACCKALERVDIVVGYSKYIEIVSVLYPNKPTLGTAMTQEVQRCKEALRLCAEGKIVAVVCSGDAGVYGMAGLVYELAERFPSVEIEVIPGITAALAGGAVLGSPFTHDFAVISLSDLLTPWEIIEKRLACAAEADFSIALYNPSSKKRCDHLKNACEILLRYKSPQTVCGLVQNIGREGQQHEIMTLAKLRLAQVDMFTTVFIGNAQTKSINGRMITPRGYCLD